MPPKRNAATDTTMHTTAAKKPRNAAVGDDKEVKDVGKEKSKRAMHVRKKALKGKNIREVDAECDLGGAEVFEDYDCMLNQAGLGANSDKYFIIQLLTTDGRYYTWRRWGRLGQSSQHALLGPLPTFDHAVSDFEKKFLDKTKNKWEDRGNFQPVAGYYALQEML